jgi:hypothetical protein
MRGKVDFMVIGLDKVVLVGEVSPSLQPGVPPVFRRFPPLLLGGRMPSWVTPKRVLLQESICG